MNDLSRVDLGSYTLGEVRSLCEQYGDYCISDCPFYDDGSCRFRGNLPQKWRLFKFSLAEIEVAKAIRFLFPNAKNVVNLGSVIRVYSETGSVECSLSPAQFPSIKSTEEYDIADIIG